MIDLAALLRHPDLPRRIAVTLAALAAYRLGAAIPLPGLDAAALPTSNVRHLSLTPVSIMALGIVPYLSALIVVEAAKIAWPRLRLWSRDANPARRLDAGVLAGAVLLAAVQAYGLASAYENVPGLVPAPGVPFRAGIAISLIAATALVVWIATLITRHGVGSGLWILVAVPHADRLANAALMDTVPIGMGGAHWLALLATVACLGFAVALLTALVTVAPPLAAHDEIVWTPVLGATAGNWLFAALFLAEWTLDPDAHQGFSPSIVSLYGYVPAFVAGLGLVALLRRRSLIEPGGTFRAATAMPLALAVIAVVLANETLALALGRPLLASAHATLVLAAVGLAVVEGLRRAPEAAANRTSQMAPTPPM